MRLLAVAATVGLLSVIGLTSRVIAAPTPSVTSRQIVGTWVTSDARSPGSAMALCGTDANDDFLPKGKYAGLFEEGAWSVSRGVVTITVTRSNYASGGEGPMKRLSKPEVRRFTVETLQDGVARVRTAQGRAWMVRCDVR